MGYIHILFGLFLAGYVNADDGGNFEECMIVFNDEYIKEKCCENIDGYIHDNFTECQDKKGKSMCDRSDCVIQHMGVKLENGRIDEASAVKYMDKVSQDKPELKDMIERTRKFCLDGQYEHYAPSDETCVSMKMYTCAFVNSMVACTKWKQNDTCQKAESAAKECKKAMDSLS